MQQAQFVCTGIFSRLAGDKIVQRMAIVAPRPCRYCDGTMIELLTTAEMAQADRLAIAAGASGIGLMEAAGRAVADAVAAQHPTTVPMVVVAGPGNNGG